MNNEMSPDEIGKKIAEIRREKQLTQDELANRVGVTPQALSQYERGLRYPDMGILKALCGVLNISADYLLGLENRKIDEADDLKIQNEIWWNLRNSLQTLAIEFGEEIVPAFMDGTFSEIISDLRLRLSREGILMPIVKFRDWQGLQPREFIVTAYDNVLYHEIIPQDSEITAKHLIEQLENVLRTKYYEILNVDLVKDMIDNLKINHGALVENVIPELVSYAEVTGICKALLKRGNSMMYFPKILETIGEAYLIEIRTEKEMIDYVASRIERPDNKWVWLHNKE